jgi:phenylalanyl-tRNA synthetase beta chain
MGTANSVVTEKTKKIVFFIDNNEPHHIRKTSMSLGIRTEAAVINEKGIDPELAMEALLYGIKLYQEIADAKVVSKIFDSYPNKQKAKAVKLTQEKLNAIIGVEISLKKAEEILKDLDFKTELTKDNLLVTPPSFRIDDVVIEEDIIEEVARIHGYNKIPSILPPLNKIESVKEEDNIFAWENRAKEALKYWGFTEVYSYSFVSQDLFEGPTDEAVTIANPLSEETAFMRKTLVPSLLEVIKENKSREEIKIFEIANIYEKRDKDLPEEILTLAGIVKKQGTSFFEMKGIVEQLFTDLGVKNISFKPSERGGLGASVLINKDYIGEIEMLQSDLVNFELNFEIIAKYASLKKVYKPFNKFPPVFEDITIIADLDILTSDIISAIKKESDLIADVYLKDQFQDARTFHVVYQSEEKNLTSDDVKKIREKIILKVKESFNATLKG